MPMRVKHRLGVLRRQAGATGHDAVTLAPSFAERAHRSRRVGTETAKVRGQRVEPECLALSLGGHVIAPGVVLVERRVSLADQHGAIPLADLGQPFEALPEARGLDPRDLLFLDTETTGLSGGTGTVVFLLGVGRLKDESFVTRQYLLTAFAGEPTLLGETADWIADAKALVSFNGKSFDVPLLAARCRLARVNDVFSKMPHVDLLHPTRRAYGSRWSDCRLGTAERVLLNFARKNDLPGAEAPNAWFSFIQSGDAGRLPAVARHNYWDLLSLAALLPVLDNVHCHPSDWGADVLSVARAFLHRDQHRVALYLLRDNVERLSEEGLLELARLYRRLDQWEQACALWETLAENQCIEALECLAKYHEHVRRDYRTALHFARRLPVDVAHEHRRTRLEQKLAQAADLLVPHAQESLTG